MVIIDCYTDASYSKDVGGSVIGYKIGDNDVVTEFLEGVKNTEAEVVAVDRCVKFVDELNESSDVEFVAHIYTDCQKNTKNESKYPNVVFHKMIGHMKNSLKDDKQKKFTLVDKITRKELRAIRKELMKSARDT